MGGVFVIYCSVTNDYKRSGFKEHITVSGLLWVGKEGTASRGLCFRVSEEAAIKVSARSPLRLDRDGSLPSAHGRRQA